MYSFSSLFSDAKNFMGNNWKIIFLITALFLILNEAVISWVEPTKEAVQAFMNQYHLADFDNIMIITNASQEVKVQFLNDFSQLFTDYILLLSLFELIELALFPSVILLLLNNSFNLGALFKTFFNNLLAILLFMVVLFIVSIFLSLIIAMAAPLLYLYFLALFILILLFQTLMISEPSRPFWSKLKLCFSFLKKEVKLILLIVGLYILCYLGLGLINRFFSESLMISIVRVFILLLINQFVLIYLFRLYQLSFK